MDYTKLYADVNQVSIRLEVMDFSETMVVHRMLVRLDELDISSGTGLLDGADKVKDLYIFADVVELPSKTVRLPGSNKIVIVCRTYVANAQSNTIDLPLTSGIKFNMETCSKTGPLSASSTIVSSSTGLQLNIQKDSYSSTMRQGGLSASQVSTLALDITTTDGNINIVTWGTSPTGSICFVGMTSKAIAPSTVVDIITDSNILLGMEVSMLIAELVKTSNNSEDLLIAVTAHVQWLNNLLLRTVDEQQLGVGADAGDSVKLLCRAQSFLKCKRPNYLTIPRLQYSMYKDLINRMVDAAQDYNQSFQLFKQQVELQKGIGSLGKFLLEQNKAFAAKEKDMETLHTQVISKRTTELNNIIGRMEQLNTQMDEAKEVMEKAKHAMEEDIEKYKNKVLAKAFFAVIGAIISVGAAFATGGATLPAAISSAENAVVEAGKAASGLKKVMEIIKKLKKVWKLVQAIRKLMESFNNIHDLVETPELPEMPSNAEWEIFVNEVELVAEQMPTEVSGAVTWKAKSKNVAALGREMTTTAFNLTQLQFGICMEKMRLEVAHKQFERLSSITLTNMTNYTEMVSQMDMRTTRMMLQLINVLYIQNAALYYEYLLVPEQLSAWPLNMQTIWKLLIQQEMDAVTGLTELGPSYSFTRPCLVQNIPVHLLKSGNDWQFEFPVSKDDVFPLTWSRVRIDYIEVRFPSSAKHVPATSKGEVYVLLQGSRLISDRAKEDNEFISYEAAMGLSYQYAYCLSTGETTVSNKPAPEYSNIFMRTTPFTHWRLRLSSHATENEGLNFPTSTSIHDTTEVEITFYVTAIRRMTFNVHAPI